MKTVIFYLGMAALGYLLAVPLRNKKELFHPIGTVLKVVVTALVFVMGFRIAASEEIMANIAMIGVNSLLMAVGSLLLTIGALYATRKLMGFDRFGYMTKGAAQNAAHDDAVTSAEKVPFWKTSPFRLGTAVALGTIAGYFTGIVWKMYDYDAMYRVTGIFVTYALYFMVFLVGVDIGSDEKAMRSLKDAGLRVLTFPIVTSAVTVSFIMIYGIFLPYSAKEMLAVACTFCWYSLGPNIIMDAGFVAAGAVAFLTNFLRVIISLITIPVVAKYIGYIETVGMSQAAAMDVCIAAIGEATNRQTAMYAFASGVVFTIIVPLLVPIIVG